MTAQQPADVPRVGTVPLPGPIGDEDMDTTTRARGDLLLPWGLRTCDVCGGVRGRTPDGCVSSCYCSGIVCNWCGRRFHRPISDYWSPIDRIWVHVPWFGFGGCSCATPPDGYEGPKLTHLPRAAESTRARR